MGAMLTGDHAGVLPRWMQWLLATPVQFWDRQALLCRRLARAARAFRQHGPADRARNLDGLPAQRSRDRFSACHGQHVYFEASAAIITLVLMPRLELWTAWRQRAGLPARSEELLQLQPKRARWNVMAKS